MSLPLENLDDKTYTELVRDALARIPTYAPRWTDRNESDPGVTFIELFAWLLEMQIYSLNRINDRTRLKFLKLLGIPRPFPARPAEMYVKFTYTPPTTSSTSRDMPSDITRDLLGNTLISPISPISPDIKYFGAVILAYPIVMQKVVINRITYYLMKASGSSGGGGLPTDYTPPAVIGPFSSVTGSKISVSSDQIYFEFDDDLLLTQESDGQYTGIARVVQGRIVTKVFNSGNTPNLGSPNLAIRLYDRLVLQEYILRVKVSGETWQWVDDLSGAAKTDKIYVADMKNGYILFGDGTHGMKPPNGTDIYVFYRASEGFVARHLVSNGSPDLQIDLTDRSKSGGCPKDPVLGNIVVKVDGDTWTATGTFPDDSSSKCYMVDSQRWIIKFGDGSKGMIPPSGASMTITYDFKKDFMSGTPQVTGSITRYVISPGKADFRLNLLDRPERLSLGDELRVEVQELSVKVAGETWQWVDDLSTAASTDKSYKADLKKGFILFGDGTHGKVPQQGAKIDIFYGGSAGYITRSLTSTGLINLQISLKDAASNLYLTSTQLVVKVDGDTWKAVTAFPDDSSSKCYMVDSAHGTIKFGDGNYGKIPPVGASLSISYPSTKGPASITRDVISPGEANFILYLLDSPQRDDLPWLYMEDLDASMYNDRHFTADPEKGIITFGNGDPAARSGRGRVPISSSIITVTYRTGVGVDGNLMTGMINFIEGSASNPAINGMTATNLTPARGGKDAETLNDAIVRARKELLEVTRCITTNDYETLTHECPRVKLARVKALPQYHPTLGNGIFDLVSLVIVPESSVMPPIPTSTDLIRMRHYLEQYRTLGTNLYVIAPTYTRVRIVAKVVRDFKYSSQDVETAVRKALHAFLNPLMGGPDGDGWPFGRFVYISEIMQVIDNVAGVDHVVMATMRSMKYGSTVWKDEGGGPIIIESHELIYSENEADHRIVAQETVT